MLLSPRTYSRRHAAVIALVLAMMAQGQVDASTVTSGCAGADEATEANGFFTLSGSTNSGANGCYVVSFDNDDTHTCSTSCAVGGLACTAPPFVTEGTQPDCTAALDWYLASSAKHPSVPSSPSAGSMTHCSVRNAIGGGAWGRNDFAFGMPANKVAPCAQQVAQSGNYGTVVPCKCDDPVDITAPTVQSVVAAQTSATSVTVTGSVDEAAHVYCKIGAPGASYTPTEVVAAGFRDDTVAAGSFSVIVTGVSTDGTTSVACVGRDHSANLGSTSSGADFEFGMTALPRSVHN